MVEYNEPMLKQIFQFRSDEFESKYAKQIENELSSTSFFSFIASQNPN